MKCLFKTLFALALALACSGPPDAALAAVQKGAGLRKTPPAEKRSSRAKPQPADADLPDGGPEDITRSGPISPGPAAPELLSRSESSLQLRYKCGHNADRHEIYRRAAGENSFRKLVLEPTCAPSTGRISNLNLLAETEYCFFVRAKNQTDEVESPTVCHSTLAPSMAPTRPVVWLQAPATDSIKVIFRDRSSNENFFEVHRRRVGESQFQVVRTIERDFIHRGTGEEEVHSDQSLPADTAFEYLVRAGYRFRDTTRAPLFTDSEIKRARTRPLEPASSAEACVNNGDEDLCDALFIRFGLRLTYYRNFDITVPRPAVVRVVFVIHGKSRKAWNSFHAMEDAAASAGVLGETLIVAPLFENWADVWRQGGTLANGMWSSFAVIDSMLEEITEKFPSLQEVVIAGHSAGGQFVQRYVGTSRFQETRPALRFRYIVGNPSSYMYLDNKRVGSTGNFSVPTTSCSSYNNYKYGLRNRNAYASAISAAAIRRQYRTRTVSYLLGQLDTGSQDLETNCAANLQGPNRLKRGLFFYRHLVETFPDAPHRIEIVPGVGHNAFPLYSSPQGRNAIFF